MNAPSQCDSLPKSGKIGNKRLGVCQRANSDMPKKSQPATTEVTDLRHSGAKRKNIPPAGIAAKGQLVRESKVKYGYNPHLPPALRFDPTGRADRLNELLAKLGSEKSLSDDEVLELQALAKADPWLEWSGKREQPECVVDPVALQVHERISTQAILRVAAREDVPRTLFADPEQDYQQAVQFYQHDVDWANRLILGDSLAVMASLARREGLAGKVQMIYMDPPYGIKYASNFQSEVGKRDVKDRDQDLTREPEMVKAYRDTWTLGVHSYLSYLRDRLLLCKELLADSGSIFVQISDDNLNRVRDVLQEVFGAGNYIATIGFQKTSSATSTLIPNTYDSLVWFARDKASLKYRSVLREKSHDSSGASEYVYYHADHGGTMRHDENSLALDEAVAASFRVDNLTSQSGGETTQFQQEYCGLTFRPGSGGWKTNVEGMLRLRRAGRLYIRSTSVNYLRRLMDFPARPISDFWEDTAIAGWGEDKRYVVQTARRVIERCLQMTTDPGDLVLDPTCGSGTTAYVAEQWGRRWVTADTSRVALSIARQRIMTARFESYKMRALDGKDVERNPTGTWLTDPTGELAGPVTFDCKTVPHITLKSIAQNQALDPIFDKWDPQLKAACDTANGELRQCSPELRAKLLAKAKNSLGEKKAKSVGNDLGKLKKALSDADWRRWVLPPDIKATRNYTTVANDFDGWYEWEMPFDVDDHWPQPLQGAVLRYRELWKAKMKEVNDTIAARAEQEELVDQPIKVPGVMRVSGPFTVEGVIPVEENIDVDEETPIVSFDEELDTFEPGDNGATSVDVGVVTNADSYLDQMTTLLRKDGVRFLNNKVQEFARLDRVTGSTHHAEGEWENGPDGNQSKLVYVTFGPQYGALTRAMVDDVLARSRKADVILFAGFSFDAEAEAEILYRKELFEAEQKARPGSTNVQQVEKVQIRPDANPVMGDLLKTTVHQQLFTVSGTPRTRLDKLPSGEVQVTMEGVDIYDPIENVVRSNGADKVAAWFVDGDYDGRTFCVTQAFFPDKSAWEKIAKHLDKSGAVDMERFEAFSGTTSLPFPPGKHKRVAVKVIDPRGNEVMKVHRLEGYDA